eukprot:CAMPEP_0179887846 /NCGR_PEP_ID=MMETSP0982-20121206/31624_1 /TAXON_ID=483367 /ORGANISM="non described non described, Strain CCMP 2436" /LENGTH=96 /DNA_ID=CAMNT_0021783705 /DNA_START=81 /DNA_END=368 /DNA_ORIENTATION=+
MSSRARARTAAPRGALPEQQQAGGAVPRAGVLVRVPQHLKVPSKRSTRASVAVLWAAARVKPAQRAQLPIPRSSSARVCCERALPVVDQLLEDVHA